MKSLDELFVMMTPIPSPFASSEKAEVTDLLSSETGVTSYLTGFPSDYGGGYASKDIPRGDFNAIGKLATQELFYRMSGGLHYSKIGDDVAYLDGSLVPYYDGTSIVDVVSCISENDVPITDVTIDCETYDQATESWSGMIYWKSASYVYGADLDLLRLSISYCEDAGSPLGDEGSPCDGIYVTGKSIYSSTGLGPQIVATQSIPEEWKPTVSNKNFTITGSVGDGSTIAVASEGKGMCGLNQSGVLLAGITYPNPICGAGWWMVSIGIRNGMKLQRSISVGYSGEKSDLSGQSIDAVFPFRISVSKE